MYKTLHNWFIFEFMLNGFDKEDIICYYDKEDMCLEIKNTDIKQYYPVSMKHTVMNYQEYKEFLNGK